MKGLTHKRVFRFFRGRLLFVAGAILVAAVVVSAGWSGYWYQFDGDELFHVNVVYVMAKGLVPYRDFFMVYTPVFHWIMTPLFRIWGFSLNTVVYIRLFFIAGFFLRLAIVSLVLWTVWNRRIAGLFIVLILADPLSTFSGMQIRPDAVMLLLYTIAVYVLVLGLRTGKLRFWFLSGLLLGASVLLLLKAIPLVVSTLGVIGFIALRKKMYKHIGTALLGLVLPIGALVAYATYRGILWPMVQEVLLDPVPLFRLAAAPPPNFFWGPDNVYIFGLTGKPIPWLYVWVLPFLAFCGVFVTVLSHIQETQPVRFQVSVRVALVVSYILQWFVILYGPAAFVQYFLPLQTFSAVFAAIALDRLLGASREKGNQRLVEIAVGAILVVFSVGSIRSNVARSTMNGVAQRQRYERLWRAIPPDEPVYTGLLFRLPVYPLLSGSFIGDHPGSILSRFGDIKTHLVAKGVRYIVIDDYYLSFLPASAAGYIKENFIKTDIPELLIRRKD